MFRKLRLAFLASIILVATAFVGTTSASASDWHLAKLDSVASSIAGHPVSVLCERSAATWVDVSRYQRGEGDGLYGFTFAPNITDPYGNVNVIYLNPTACETFHVYAANGWGKPGAARDAGLHWLAGAALTLVHESVHQFGYTDEGATECEAMRLMPQALPYYFGVPAKIKVHRRRVRNPMFSRLLAWTRYWHNGLAPEYQAC
jgi:hypothetical protein